jgi:hypothetical protein
MESNFVKALGNTPKIRIWDYLVVTRGTFDFSMTDLSEGADVSWNTLKEMFPYFVRNKILLPTRKIGRANLYKLNEEHPESVFMIELHKAISMVFVHGGKFKMETKIVRIDGKSKSLPREVDIPIQKDMFSHPISA